MLDFIIWDPNIFAFHIGSFGIRWYSICWAVGLILAYYVVYYLYKKQKIDDKLFEPLFLYCFLGILIGARLGHCLFYEPEYFLGHPIEMLLPIHNTLDGWKFTGYTGLASHGGVLGIMISLWLYVRRTKINIMRVVDNISIATPITAFAIRIGNLMNSEIVGKATDMPWGFIFVRNNESFARHPGQLYEAIAYFILFFIGLWLYKKYPKKVGTGYFFGFCLTTVFIFRFFVEFFKDIQVTFESSMSLDMGQLLSIPFIILGAYCWIGGKYCRKIGEKQK